MDHTRTGDYFLQLLDHPHFIPVAGMIVGAIAIVSAATTVIVVAKLWLGHRQRMAMIARGVHPDAVDFEYETPRDVPIQDRG